MWQRHAARAQRAGLDRFYVILSFDCDTDKDIEVAPRVAERLRALDIAATFAVPGEQLRRGQDVYRELFRAGHEFIAHGDHEHCVLRDGDYISSFFYDELGRDTVAGDIERATNTFTDIFGTRPIGFRTPHFGSFQGGAQLAFLHTTLRGLGYRFSSSTMPLYGLWHGPVRVFNDGFAEVPLTGCFTAPLGLLDSYGFRFAAGRRPSEERYAAEFTGILRYFGDRGLPGLMSTYVDPSQVHDFPPFWDSVETLASMAVSTLSYSRLLELVT